MLMDDYIVHQLESRLEADQQREYEHKIALLKDGRREGEREGGRREGGREGGTDGRREGGGREGGREGGAQGYVHVK